ncbi:hypothetical protein [Mycoplasma suis]|uniref:Uncharacterized protein n=1 Tax=Mycoplasma suis (strain Illinois) TaxID=768700 RepID=F0QQ31_MYCSL|nr:hypothetical protein [Mycoplasma suis]ADX97601.1 hypothetical protein MSU_0057 [Mycoplasma suis str. Illinois]
MALLGLSSKVFYSIIIGVLGSGAIAGSVFASNVLGETNNNNLLVVEGDNDGNSGEKVPPTLPPPPPEIPSLGDKDDTDLEDLEKEDLDEKPESNNDPANQVSSDSSKKSVDSGRKESQQQFLISSEVREESDKGEDLQLKNYSSDSEDISESEESKNKRYDEERLREGIVLETLWIFKTGGGSSEENRSCTLLKKGESKKIPNIIEKQEEEEETGKSCDDYDAVTSQWSDEKRIDDKIEGFWVRGENQLVKELIKENWGDRDLFKISGFAEKEKTLPENISDNLGELFKETTTCSTRILQEQNWIELSCLINSINQ